MKTDYGIKLTKHEYSELNYNVYSHNFIIEPNLIKNVYIALISHCSRALCYELFEQQSFKSFTKTKERSDRGEIGGKRVP